MRSLYDIVTFDVYGALPEDQMLSPKMLQSIVDNDPIIQTVDFCYLGSSTWAKMISTDDDYYCDDTKQFLFKSCCRKATYLCRVKDKLYLLVEQV